MRYAFRVTGYKTDVNPDAIKRPASVSSAPVKLANCAAVVKVSDINFCLTTDAFHRLTYFSINFASNQRGKRGQNARVAKPILMICIELYVLRFFDIDLVNIIDQLMLRINALNI